MSVQVEQWLKFANEDLQVAEILLREKIYAQACFHSQQCVEKAFKSVLIHSGASVPRIHSIVTLAKLMPPALMAQIESDVSIFDDFYIPARYPDTLPGGLPDGPPSTLETEEAVTQARDIFRKIKHYLAK